MNFKSKVFSFSMQDGELEIAVYKNKLGQQKINLYFLRPEF